MSGSRSAKRRLPRRLLVLWDLAVDAATARRRRMAAEDGQGDVFDQVGTERDEAEAVCDLLDFVDEVLK